MDTINEQELHIIGKMSTSKEILEVINKKLIKCSKKEIEISSKVIEGILTEDINLIKYICIKGFPDDVPILRALVWKILLNYIPISHLKWEEVIKEKRKMYYFYKEQFKNIKKEDYDKKQYKNIDILELITKDINRTHVTFNFFYQPTSKTKQFNSEELQNILQERQNCALSNPEQIYKFNVTETHAEVLERILFIYAKLNPDISYKQGMNEIVSVLYYCLSYDKLYIHEYEENIEADTFWCFFNLMNNIKSSFDNCAVNSPIIKVQIMTQVLSIIDPNLSLHFKEIDLSLEYFCCKWFILFFSQNYMVHDILRLWDIIFCEHNKFYYVYYAGLAIFKIKRDVLLKSSMIDCIVELQNVEDIDIDSLIYTMLDLKKNYSSKIDVYLQKQDSFD